MQTAVYSTECVPKATVTHALVPEGKISDSPRLQVSLLSLNIKTFLQMAKAAFPQGTVTVWLFLVPPFLTPRFLKPIHLASIMLLTLLHYSGSGDSRLFLK